MENDNKHRRNEPVFSRKIRAGRRRTYFFDVRPTRSNDYYLTITESKRRYNEDGYDRHKIFLYKEDFNKFLDALNESVDHVKTDLLPEYDFDEFTRKPEDPNNPDYDRDDDDDSDDNEESSKKDTLSNEDVGVDKAPLKEETDDSEAETSPRKSDTDEDGGDDKKNDDETDDEAMKW